MDLRELLKEIDPLATTGSPAREVTGLAYDSRRVVPGEVFFALPGVRADGADFIAAAREAGATAVVSEQPASDDDATVCHVRVSNARRAMAAMAAAFYRYPTRGIPVIGVTGTNGKTTVTYLLEAILGQAGYAPAVFGTIEYRFQDQHHAAAHTTPEAVDLMRMMADFRKRGADALILEVSSHALEQHRVDGIEFDCAVFTNLTPEHLDYHETLERYFASKARLFKELLGSGKAVVNLDDPFGERLCAELPGCCSFGLEASARVHPRRVSAGRDGIEAVVARNGAQFVVTSELIGEFNISNLLAAVAAADQLGIGAPAITRGIAAAPRVPGRLEKVANQRRVLALVDYAHTSDALEQVLRTLVKLEHRRFITVVGCGGDRDPAKRPLMAAAAVHHGHLAILTADNPRTEDPLRILDQMERGAREAGGRELTREQAAQGDNGFVIIPDRREAIAFAGRLALPGDLLLVAGKGHEDYQILGTRKIHFDDREELARALVRPSGVSHAES